MPLRDSGNVLLFLVTVWSSLYKASFQTRIIQAGACDVSGHTLTRQQHGVFLHRLADLVWFSSQRALINLQVVALDQGPISRQQVSCEYRGQRSEDLISISSGKWAGSLTAPAFHLFLSFYSSFCFSPTRSTTKCYIYNRNQTEGWGQTVYLLLNEMLHRNSQSYFTILSILWMLSRKIHSTLWCVMFHFMKNKMGKKNKMK